MNWPKAGCQTLAWVAVVMSYRGSGSESDLTTVDRDFLIAIIAQLQVTVLEQQRVIEVTVQTW